MPTTCSQISEPSGSSSLLNPKSRIDLFRGWPSATLLPTALLLTGAIAALSEDQEALTQTLSYGPDQGGRRIRESVAKWLTAYYEPSVTINASRIAVTGGASQSLGCVMQVYTDPAYTIHVWCVVPCYMLACRIMGDAGFAHKIRAVPEDEEGIDIAYLRRELGRSEELFNAHKSETSIPRCKSQRGYKKFYRHVIYAVPTFSNPSSKVMSLRRRKQLVLMAREFDALVICDDVYDFLQWNTSTTKSFTTNGIDKALIARLVDIDSVLEGGAERPGSDGFGNVVSNGSFSKIAAPGLRIGWVEGTPKFAFGASQAGTTHSGGSPSHTVASIIAELLDSGKLHRFILDVLQPKYALRYNRMREAVMSRLVPLGSRLMETRSEWAGGFFIWLMLPKELDATHVATRAEAEENVIVAPGPLFEVRGDSDATGTSFKNNIRLCFAWEDEERLEEGIERLANSIQRMLDTAKVTD